MTFFYRDESARENKDLFFGRTIRSNVFELRKAKDGKLACKIEDNWMFFHTSLEQSQFNQHTNLAIECVIISERVYRSRSKKGGDNDPKDSEHLSGGYCVRNLFGLISRDQSST